MLAVTLGLVGFFGFVMLRMSQPAMSVLFSDLSQQDVSAILKDLDTRGIKYELRSDGQTVLVAKADVPRLRLDLASKGIPAGGGVGYEIFDKGDAFSSTSFVQNINHLRALEGELSRTIRSIGRVQSARVHLVIPERRLFERDREPPRASIALKLAGDLDPAQVRAVRHLVASAVDGLKPERVSIVDERGRLLADGAQGDAGPGRPRHRGAPDGDREAGQAADRGHRRQHRRPGPGARAGLGGARQQPRREPVGNLRPGEQGGALEPEPHRECRDDRGRERRGHGRQRVARRAADARRRRTRGTPPPRTRRW